MKRQFVIYIILFLCACSQQNKNTEEQHEEHQQETGNTVSLTAEQAKAIQVELGKVEQKQLTASLKANGILKVPNQNKASINSYYGGIVNTILVQPGNTVTKGQVIATVINPSVIVMQEEYLSLAAKIKFAEKEFQRQKELSTQNAGALKVLQQTEAELSALITRRSSLHKQLELIGVNLRQLNNDNMSSVIQVRSPVAGAISHVLVNIGSKVDLNSPLAEVVDNSQLHLDLYVYEKDLPKLKVGQIIHFTLTNRQGKEYDAEIFGIGNTFEDETKAVAVHAVVKGDKSGLIDGMSITALVSLDQATVPAVPSEAIVNYKGNDYVFILVEKEVKHIETKHDHGVEGHSHDPAESPKSENGKSLIFERVAVRKGSSDIGYSEITFLNDVPASASVVVKGSFFLLAKMTNAGEHSH